ncbi:MAG: 50S ribosomal protein L15 [Dehalococcoidia bacterium]|nr:50S ribosomal protein L15 [Dehalococcoidia bacterium]
MRQHDLRPAPGSKHARKRLGRGDGSGHGSYCGRGLKGQKSRSGPDIPRGFEGGQLPIIKRLPQKRGFTNIFKVKYAIVKVGQLKVFPAGAEVTPKTLAEARVIDSSETPVKLLADGEIRQPLMVKVHKSSAAAKAKIEAAGGKVEEIK